MADKPNPRITLEFEAHAEPIRGTVDDGDGFRHAFWGWLELLEAISRRASGDAAPPSGGARPHDAQHPTSPAHEE